MRHRLIIGALSLAIVSFCPAYLGGQEQTPTTDPVAKPKKPATSEPTASPDKENIPSEFKKPKDAAAAGDVPTFRTTANTVVVDVSVLDDKDNFLPRIPKENFRISEDGVPQQITQFGNTEAPITICMLIEFSGRFQAYWSSGWRETLQASYGFLQTLKPDDNVAVVTYDLRTTILSDFSPDKRNAEEAMARLRIPGFSESNVFDALTDMADRMTAIEGRKAILLIATGLDTFRHELLSAFRRRISPGFPHDRKRHAPAVFFDLSPHEFGEGWEVSAHQGGVDRFRYQRADAGFRCKEQADEIPGHSQVRLQSATRSGIVFAPPKKIACQELNLACFEFDSGSLTLPRKTVTFMMSFDAIRFLSTRSLRRSHSFGG